MKPTMRRSPRGTVLICVLACLIVVTALIGSTTQAALRARNAARIEKQVRQGELLLEAGVLRAAQQLKKSADYEGEQWRPRLLAARQDSTETGAHDDESSSPEAAVDIRVTPSDDPSTRKVEVIARLQSPAAGPSAIQRSHRFTFKSSPTSSSEKQ
ncbi:MAG: hypothetical protein ACTHK7_12095 [Aureliella sp.]